MKHGASKIEGRGAVFMVVFPSGEEALDLQSPFLLGQRSSILSAAVAVAPIGRERLGSVFFGEGTVERIPVAGPPSDEPFWILNPHSGSPMCLRPGDHLSQRSAYSVSGTRKSIDCKQLL